MITLLIFLKFNLIYLAIIIIVIIIFALQIKISHYYLNLDYFLLIIKINLHLIYYQTDL
jgi:hypothetical protein